MPRWRRLNSFRGQPASVLLARLRATFSSGEHDELEDLPLVEEDELRLRVACALVIDAQHGWPAEHRINMRALQVWELYHSTPVQILRYVNVFAYLSIAYAETPGWCFDRSAAYIEDTECSNATLFKKYETAGWHVLPHASSLALETICLLLFTVQLAARLFIMGCRRFFRSRWHVLQLVLLCLMMSDVGLAASPVLWHRTHFTRPMRAIFVVSSHKRLRDTTAAIVLMLPNIFELLTLLVFMVLFFAWLATLLFNSTDDSSNKGSNKGFETFSRSFYSLGMLLTSTNFPDVALPAYYENGFTYIFFVVFQFTCVFVGMNLLLSLVYRSYCAHMRADASTLHKNRLYALHAAYRQLCGSTLPSAQLSSLALTHASFAQLMHRLRPDLLPWQIGLCFEALDENQRGVLELREFEAVLSALQVQFEDPPSASHARRHRLKLRLRTLLADWRTKLCLDLAVALNAALIALQSRDSADDVSCAALVCPQLPFLLLWLTASASYGFAFGVVRGLLLGWNGFDNLLTLGCFASLPVLIATSCHPDATWSQALRAFTLLRLLRLVRLFTLSSRFRLLLSALYAMRTPFITFFVMLVAFLYLFAACGMELLGGVWHRNASCLEGTEYDANDYYATNFNDFPSAMVTAWALVMVNNYGVYMDAGYACDRSHRTTVFFVGFYFTLVVLLFNLLTSFVLESVLSSFDRADAAEAASAERAAERAAAAAAAEQEERLAMSVGSFLGTPPSLSVAGGAALGGGSGGGGAGGGGGGGGGGGSSAGLGADEPGSPTSLRAPHVPTSASRPGNAPYAHDWQGMQEAQADEAERFAETCAARLRAEGNDALVSLRRPRDDGYSTLVKLLAGQTDAMANAVQRAARRGRVASPSGSRASGLNSPLVY